MNNKIFSLIVVLICFGIIVVVIAINWIMIAFDYQDQLIELNQQNYELRQSIEMYKLVTGELR